MTTTTPLELLVSVGVHYAKPSDTLRGSIVRVRLHALQRRVARLEQRLADSRGTAVFELYLAVLERLGQRVEELQHELSDCRVLREFRVTENGVLRDGTIEAVSLHAALSDATATLIPGEAWDSVELAVYCEETGEAASETVSFCRTEVLP